MSRIRKSLQSVFDYHGKNGETSSNSNASINPYLHTLNEQTKILSDTSFKLTQRLKACDKIAYAIYLGGMIIEPSLKKDSRMIDIVIDVLMKESEDIQKAAQLLTIITRCGKVVQEILIEKRLFSVLNHLMMNHQGEMRKWAISGLLTFLSKNTTKFRDQVMEKSFKDTVSAAIDDDWSLWKVNEANELDNLIQLMY